MLQYGLCTPRSSLTQTVRRSFEASGVKENSLHSDERLTLHKHQVSSPESDLFQRERENVSVFVPDTISKKIVCAWLESGMLAGLA
jgi:hypothetical protein